MLLAFALTAGAAIVLLAHVFVEPGRLPFGFGLDLKFLRPGASENLRIVDGQIVVEGVLILPADLLNGAQGVAVHAEFFGIGVVVIVERPAVEVGRFDNQGVTLPVADGIAVIHRLQSLPMRTPVERNDPRHPLKLVHHHQVILRLEKLHRVGGRTGLTAEENRFLDRMAQRLRKKDE